MTIEFLLVISILLLVAEIGLFIYKSYQILRRLDKVCNFFIRSEQYLNGERIQFGSLKKGIPPINGECPTKEELDNFQP